MLSECHSDSLGLALVFFSVSFLFLNLLRFVRANPDKTTCVANAKKDAVGDFKDCQKMRALRIRSRVASKLQASSGLEMKYDDSMEVLNYSREMGSQNFAIR